MDVARPRPALWGRQTQVTPNLPINIVPTNIARLKLSGKSSCRTSAQAIRATRVASRAVAGARAMEMVLIQYDDYLYLTHHYCYDTIHHIMFQYIIYYHSIV